MESETTPIKERRADSTTQLHIDEAILDYLTFKATKALLRDFQTSKECRHGAARKPKAGLHLDLVDSFLVMFRTMHPTCLGNPELRHRLRLLRFTTLFTNRHPAKDLEPWTQRLQLLRTVRQEKANAFRSSIDLPILTEHMGPSKDLQWIKQEHALGQEASERPKRQENVPLPLISLLDTLPSFMALSAAENAMQESNITETWMRLAAGYMAQAAIEQCLYYGSQIDEVLKQAFSWGFDPETTAEEGSDDWIVNAMFLDEESEFESWHEIRNEHMRALIPAEDSDLLEHLKLLRENELSLPAFEQIILQFLNGLLYSLASPLLVQLESGRIDSLPLPREVNQALKQRIGIA